MAIVLLIKCPDGTVVDAPMFGSIVVIGRSSKADIKIEDPLLSSQQNPFCKFTTFLTSFR